MYVQTRCSPALRIGAERSSIPLGLLPENRIPRIQQIVALGMAPHRGRSRGCSPEAVKRRMVARMFRHMALAPTAVHEAGHIAVGLLHGLPMSGAELHDSGDRSGSASYWKLCLPRPESPDGWKVIDCCLAGSIAEVKFRGVPVGVNSVDAGTMRAYIDRSGPPSRRKASEIRTGQLVNRHWPAIAAVAMELLVKDRLGKVELLAILKPFGIGV